MGGNLTQAQKDAADTLQLELGAQPPPKRNDLVEALFIGADPDGQLMKGAPGNYKRNRVYMIPVSQLVHPWWRQV